MKYLTKIYSSGQDRQSEPLSNAEAIWLIDGSSFMGNALKRARYAVVSLDALVNVKRLAPGTPDKKGRNNCTNQSVKIG